MALINVTNITDGTTADASDVNSQINTIVNEFNGSIDNANIKSGAAIATSKLASDEGIINAMVADAAITPEKLLASTGTTWVWQDWTPSYVNVTAGNGTVTAKYCQIGKTVFVDWCLVLGSTSSVSNSYTVTLPVTAAARYGTANVYYPIGLNYVNDITGNVHAGTVRTNSTTVMQATVDNFAGALGQQSATFPITEATGDTVTITAVYEAA